MAAFFMRHFRRPLAVLAIMPVIAVLAWAIAVPTSLIEEKIEEAVVQSQSGSLSLSVDGLRKGVLFSLHAGNLDLNIDGSPALTITDISGRFSPRSLLRGKLVFPVDGRIGAGDVRGMAEYPDEGRVTITGAELSAIPYLRRFGMDISGSLNSLMHIKGDSMSMTFDVHDLMIDDSASLIPLLNTFRNLRGALSVAGNRITIESISLEGDKGYARLKGDITDNLMNLTLELMPEANRLNAMESMIIGKYIVSPGYYAVPIRGPVPR